LQIESVFYFYYDSTSANGKVSFNIINAADKPELIMYPDQHSKSASLFERAQKVLPGGNSRHAVYYAPYPIYAVSANGYKFTDVEGNEYVDFVNNMTSLMHGHSHPKVVAAVQAQASKLMTIASPTELELEYAEFLVDRLPGVDQLRFVNSGTEGIMYALKAARGYTGRRKIARVEGLYHGGADFLETSQLADPNLWGPIDAPNSVPTAGISPTVSEDIITLPMDDIEASRRILDQHADELAAIIFDPFAPKLAFYRSTPEFLQFLRDYATEKGALLIYDEVMSFRMGYNGAQGVVGVTPDLTCLGKVVGGGLALGAFGGKAEYMSVFNQLDTNTNTKSIAHSGTYNANPLAVTAGLTSMREATPEVYAHMGNLGERLRNGVNAALTDTGVAGVMTGHGPLSFLCLGVNSAPKNFRDMAHLDMAANLKLHHHLLNNGMSTAEGVAYIVSSVMTEQVIDEAVEKIHAGLSTLNEKASD
jgi:glutamate-1-semialdehyde 2,1-aminomutase